MEEKIITAAVDAFAQKGLKFTMDDIAHKAGISKKTLYQVFDSKEALCYAVVEQCFIDIKEAERNIFFDDSLSTMDKLRNILVVLPERYTNIGISDLGMLKEKMPNVYGRLAMHLESDWDMTITLLELAMQEGLIRPICIPVFKTIIQSTIQNFFSGNVLKQNDITYETALKEMLDIVIDGISL